MTELNDQSLRQLLDVTRKLAQPFDLDELLGEVVNAARSILHADRGSVFLYEADKHELIAHFSADLGGIRLPADVGIVGECVRTRTLINVPDCYADERFYSDIDRQTGYHSRCMLSIPLIGYDDSLVGVLQILNKVDGVFDTQDEFIASALAAQAAVVLQRAKMTETMLATQKLDREIAVAREVQMGTLPKHMPTLPDYSVGGEFSPTDQTGGDLYDFVPLPDDRLFLLMGDATGHGIGPALSATQVRAMLRVAVRLGASLDDAFVQINDQLVDDLPDDRFVTGFFGILDAVEHTVRFHSGGQGPILHYRAADDAFDWHPASTFPLGYVHQQTLGNATELTLGQGDILGLISDGIFEYENPAGDQFGQERVAEAVRSYDGSDMTELVAVIMAAVRTHGGAKPQADDITIVLVHRKA